MWKSRLFWKLFGGFVVAGALLLLLMTATAVSYQQTVAARQLRQQLQTTAELLATGLSLTETGENRMELLSQAVGRNPVRRLQVTVLDRDGRIIWDSADPSAATVGPPDPAASKGRQPPVPASPGEEAKRAGRAATAGGTDHSARDLPEFAGIFVDRLEQRVIPPSVADAGRPVVYRAGKAFCAASIQGGDRLLHGAVRVALPVDGWWTPGRGVWWWLLVDLVLAAAVACAISWWASRRISRPVLRLCQAADQFTAGEYGRAVYVGNSDELGDLAKAFNRMRVEMHRREDELRETSQRLATVLGGMTDGVIAVGPRENVIFSNAAAGRLMRFNHVAAQGRSLLETVRNHTLHRVASELLFRPGQRQFEIEVGDGGSEVTLSVTATSLPGEPTAGVVMVFNNLTELRRIEAMRRDFVANVSHELKTPLSSIKAYAETLLNGAINDPANRERFVRQIEEQSERLNQLIKDLLSLARVESGKQFFNRESISVKKFLEGCFREQRLAADAKQLALRTAPDLPDLLVRADEEAMRQIFLNLIDNAIKYTPQGSVTASWFEGPPGFVSIRIADTGMGIPAEMQSRVFERFFRVDRARSREIGGTGLGLSIVKHLTQSLGGTVHVAGNPDGGSIFTVCLPRAQADPERELELDVGK